MKRKDFLRIVIDLDGTILEEKDEQKRPEPLPLAGAVGAVNTLYEMGHQITIYTARGQNDLELTLRQLKEYGVKYHNLVLGKPVGDIFIDDRAYAFKDWRKDWHKVRNLVSEKMKQPYEEKDNCEQRQS